MQQRNEWRCLNRKSMTVMVLSARRVTRYLYRHVVLTRRAGIATKTLPSSIPAASTPQSPAMGPGWISLGKNAFGVLVAMFNECRNANHSAKPF